jgi:hypothetical protein
MNDAEIAGYMDWRGPGAYTERQLVRIRRIVEEVRKRESEACANAAGIALLGADRDLTERVLKTIRARGGKA